VIQIWYSTKKNINVHFVRGGLKKNYVVNRKKKSKLKSGERQKNLGMIDFEPGFFYLSFFLRGEFIIVSKNNIVLPATFLKFI